MNPVTFPEMYERWLVGALFRPWAEVLVERAGVAAGERVLDVACGTGIVARIAHERVGDTGRVVGVDVNVPMLDIARVVDPGVDWREGNAMALPVTDLERFDVVLSNQGLQFFPDKLVALREMRRVLEPNGRLALAVWRSLDEAPVLRELNEVAERHLGPIQDRRYAFGDATALGQLIIDAGFQNVDVESATRTIRFTDGAMFVQLNSMALVGMSANGPSMTEEERSGVADVISRESAGIVKAHTNGGGFVFEIAANIATATLLAPEPAPPPL